MIEDDLRVLLSDMDVPVYSRIIPRDLPECVTVQEIGGRACRSGIRRSVHTVSLMAVSADRATAISRLRTARDILITGIPADVGPIHYYTAVAVADGSLSHMTDAGPKFVEFVDMNVEASL